MVLCCTLVYKHLQRSEWCIPLCYVKIDHHGHLPAPREYHLSYN